ncbi:ADP ribosylation factor 79F [Zopfochytrium polystomum]|nr:ADP ribosylation factor 79F [Zopfochytrium polystomum]
MGNIFARAFGGSRSGSSGGGGGGSGQLFGGKEVRILMLGLDNSGKTTILYKLKLKKEQPQPTVPTVGFNMENVKYKNVSFQMWDCGGQDSIRPLWRHYFNGCQGLIFVVDATDRQRVEEARNELFKIMENTGMADVPVCVFANKQDLPQALSTDLLAKYLNLNTLPTKWAIFGTSATEGSGLLEALQWLSKQVEVLVQSSSGRR